MTTVDAVQDRVRIVQAPLALLPWQDGAVMSRPRSRWLLRVLLPLLALGLQGAGCAQPYAGPKTLAALGAGLLTAGGTTWVLGDRQNRDALANSGLAVSALGAAAVFVAGGWLAAGVACTEDPDCPRNEECREIPTQPGGYPYRQCMPRQGP